MADYTPFPLVPWFDRAALVAPSRASSVLAAEGAGDGLLSVEAILALLERADLDGLADPLTALVAKSADYTVTTADNRAIISCTSGGETLTLPALADIAAVACGYVLRITQQGASAATIVPAGSEFIEGAAYISVAQGELAMIFPNADASAWRAVIIPAAGASVSAASLAIALANYVKLTSATVQALTGGLSQAVVTLTPVSGVLTLDFALGNHFKATLVANTSLVVANLPAAGKRQEFTLDVIQDATGGRTLSFASAFKWPGKTAAPSITTTANAINTLTGFANSTDVVTVFAGAR